MQTGSKEAKYGIEVLDFLEGGELSYFFGRHFLPMAGCLGSLNLIFSTEGVCLYCLQIWVGQVFVLSWGSNIRLIARRLFFTYQC